MAGPAVSAADVLSTAQAAGIRIHLDGEDLVLQAPAPPPPALLDVLSAYKAEIVAVLRAKLPSKPADQADDLMCARDAYQSPAITEPRRWRDRYMERSAHHESGGSRPRAEAERLAWAEMQNRWHMERGECLPRDICVGCRRPIGPAAALDLVDGNRVHFSSDDCLARHGERWRTAATLALRALGLRPPATDL